MQLLPSLNFISIVGEILAKDFDCNFGEVAAADQVVEVSDINKNWQKKGQFDIKKIQVCCNNRSLTVKCIYIRLLRLFMSCAETFI